MFNNNESIANRKIFKTHQTYLRCNALTDHFGPDYVVIE
jgi:hypothetical protein